MEVYSHDLLAHLQTRGFDVRVLVLDPRILARRLACLDLLLPETTLERLCPGYVRIGRRAWNVRAVAHAVYGRLARSFRRLPKRAEVREMEWGQPLTPVEEACVRTVARRAHWDVVIVNHCWLADALACFGEATTTAVLTHDVWHHHVGRALGNPYLRALDREREAAYLRAADLVVAITERDGGEFATMVEARKIVTAPMSCTPRFSDVEPVAGRLLFVGSAYTPNVEGVSWFLRVVGPALERAAPGRFELHVVGAVGRDLAPVGSGIRVVPRGFVKDIHPEYHAAQVVIVPLLTGSGLKIKLVEALAHGKAVVTTPVGAQGVEHSAGNGLLVVPPTEDMARAILDLAHDGAMRRRIETGARRIATEDLSGDACYGPLALRLA